MTAARTFVLILMLLGWWLLFGGLGVDNVWDGLKIVSGMALLISSGVLLIAEGGKK